MDGNLYDEFGNYIGPDIDSDIDSADEVEDENLQDKHLEENGLHARGEENSIP
jgi:U5 small nuclear ribonucleoprotein component